MCDSKIVHWKRLNSDSIEGKREREIRRERNREGEIERKKEIEKEK